MRQRALPPCRLLPVPVLVVVLLPSGIDGRHPRVPTLPRHARQRADHPLGALLRRVRRGLCLRPYGRRARGPLGRGRARGAVRGAGGGDGSGADGSNAWAGGAVDRRLLRHLGVRHLGVRPVGPRTLAREAAHVVRAVLGAVQFEEVAPDELEHEPVRRLVLDALALVPPALGGDEPRRDAAVREPRRELRRVIGAEHAVARLKVPVPHAHAVHVRCAHAMHIRGCTCMHNTDVYMSMYM